MNKIISRDFNPAELCPHVMTPTHEILGPLFWCKNCAFWVVPPVSFTELIK